MQAAPATPVVVQVDHGPVIPHHSGEFQPPRSNRFVEYWRKVGGGSFMLSLAIHAGLLIAAYFVVETIVHEQKVDFLPGGGSSKGQAAEAALTQSVQQKKRNTLNRKVSMQRVVTESPTANITLPDAPMETIDVPSMSSMLGAGGSMGAGFGSAGAGGGFGSGFGTGGLDGMTFQPLFMFGQSIKARRIGVVMDVSGSMTPHLTTVIKELDRVAAGSPVILFEGCGLKVPPKGKKLDDKTFRTMSNTKDKDRSFEHYWRITHTRRPDPNAPVDPKKKKKDEDEIPEKEVYEVLAKRQQTWFIRRQGIHYAWLALMADELRHVDAVYWFADFQDATDEKQLERVLEVFERRKQKLYIHASQKGPSFATIRDTLVLPTGGSVIEAETRAKKPADNKKPAPADAKKDDKKADPAKK